MMAYGMIPYFSIVIPLFNEETVLPHLLERLLPAAADLPQPYEIILVNDGSRDGTLDLLLEAQRKHPDIIHVVDLLGNVGQYQAIVAGFAHARGTYVFIMDADLQNYPEDMQRLLPALEGGADYVGSYRECRNDTLYRDMTSRLNNWLRKSLTGIDMKDHGCMLRAFHRDVVEGVLAVNVTSPFLTLQAHKFAKDYQEVPVRHAERAAGESKYTLLKLVKIHFDWMTHFTELPLHIALVLGVGIVVSSLAGFLAAVLWGTMTTVLLTLVLFTLGCLLMAVGMVGSYVARVYKGVMQKAPFVVRAYHSTATNPYPKAVHGAKASTVKSHPR